MSVPANLAELRTLIARRLGEDANQDLSTEIAQAVSSAIDFYSEEPIWFLEIAKTIGLSTELNVATDGLPDDLVAIDEATINNGEYPLEQTSFERLRWLTGSGKPQFYAEWGDQIHFHPVPDAVYPYELYYRRRLADLGVDDTNEWVSVGWRLIQSHAMWDLSTHVLHKPPIDAERYWDAAEIELEKLTSRSRGHSTAWRPRARAARRARRQAMRQPVMAGAA